MATIEELFPEARWWYGGAPTDFNPFIHLEEGDSYPEEICSLTIGWFSTHVDRISYGMYCQDDYNYESQDGWDWYEKYNFDADETSAMFDDLNESIKRDWRIDDLKTLHDNKVLFYEIGSDGYAVKHSDIIGDEMGDILYIGTQNGRYTICYKLNVEEIKGVEEWIMSSENTIIKWLNNGVLQPTHKFINFDEGEFFEPINENTEHDDFRIGDFVIVNGFYEGVIHSTYSRIYFDDDFAKVIDVVVNSGSGNKWYLLSFREKEFSTDKSLPNSIYLMKGKSEGISYKLNITIEHPEELDLDTLFS